MKTLIPAQTVAPANIGPPWQPAAPPALSIARGCCRGVKRLEGTALGLEESAQIQKTRHQRTHLTAQQAVKLAACRQGRKRPAHMALRIAIKTALTAKWLPLTPHGQR